MKHWYTNAASSSKDIIILMEQSGSMNLSRLFIAQDVVRNILDTLSVNDYVNVFTFNDSVYSLIDCNKDFLAQATSQNIFQFKQALNDVHAKGQTDLAEALYKAFDLLDATKRKGAHCNQVIMLITDGMEYNETIQEIFKKYNWEKNFPVRVFSYLIGEMIPEHDYEQVKTMACDNRGFYVQIDTKTETREQVLKYIPVMSRPLAFNRTQNPVVWSSMYADVLVSFAVSF
jgi:voltage-dependent calcium channel alpha-2/delta-3